MKTYALVISGLMLQLLAGVCGAAEAAPATAPATATAAATVPAEAKVGALGSAKRLVFEGNVTFSSEHLQQGLRVHGDWVLAAHPAAPLAGYVKATREALLRGYQRAGFPLAEVKETRWLENPQRLLCVISEGPRYMAGAVTVTGTRSVPAALIVEKLTTGEKKPAGKTNVLSSEKKAEWEKDKPAKLDFARNTELRDVVLKLMEKEGLMQAKVNVDIVRNDAARTAELKVRILSEGPRAVLDDIIITGLKRDSQTALLKYLGLRRGLPFLAGQVQEIEKQLLESARYTSYKVTATPHKADRPEMDLKLELVEMPEAPKLDKPLPAAQATLVNAAAWMNHVLNSGEEDLLLSVNYFPKTGGMAAVEMTYNALKGLHLELQMADDVTGVKNVRRCSMHYARDEVKALLWAHEGRTKQWMSYPIKKHYIARLFANITTDEPKDGKTLGTLSFGAGLNQKSTEAGNRLLNFELNLTPAAALLDTLREKEEWVRKDGLLISESPMVPGGNDEYFALEEKTGRLRELSGGKWEKDHKGYGRYRLKTEVGAWERVTREMEAQSAGLTNSYEKGEPLASWAGFLTACYVHGDLTGKKEAALSAEEAQRRIAMVQEVARRMSVSVPSFYSAFTTLDGDSFFVPGDPDKPRGKEMTSSMVAELGLTVVDALVEEGSWPWLLAREVYYSTSGRNEYTGSILDQVRGDPQLGPVGSYLASVLLDWTLPAEAGGFRQLAQAKLSADEFRRDWGLLLQNTSESQRAAGLELLEKLRDGSANVDWVKDVVFTVGKGTKVSLHPVLNTMVTELRRDKERPLAEAVTAVMDSVWNEELGGLMRTALTPKGKDGKPVDPALVAAVVGDVEISRAALADEVATRRQVFLRKPGGTQAKLSAQRAGMEEEALKGLIEVELYNAAFKAMGNVIDVKFGDQGINEIVANAFEGNRAGLEQELKKVGMTIEEYREKLAKQAVAQAMRMKVGEMAQPPTAEEVARKAEALKTKAEPERQVLLRTLSVPKKTVEQGEEAQQKLVNDLRAQLVAGGDFAKLAKKHSADSRASDGGRMDWMPPALLSAAIGGPLAKMKPGEVSDALDLGTVWILVKFEEERLQPKSAAELQKEAKALLKEEKAEEFRQGWLNNVRGKFKVEILPRAEKMLPEGETGTPKKNTGC
ncbi:peptidylprolyl isomerase [Prosthecobacter sp.]|uniref:peptidylprolyl isomerase n=1 Tax=Prosthecobacter sp. TaxID=1965333 RepID=UPI0037831247